MRSPLYTGVESRFTVVSTQRRVYSCIIIYLLIIIYFLYELETYFYSPLYLFCLFPPPLVPHLCLIKFFKGQLKYCLLHQVFSDL